MSAWGAAGLHLVDPCGSQNPWLRWGNPVICPVKSWNGSVSKPCTPVVHIKIAGKWMFIPLKMVLIGIDPYPNILPVYPCQKVRPWVMEFCNCARKPPQQQLSSSTDCKESRTCARGRYNMRMPWWMRRHLNKKSLPVFGIACNSVLMDKIEGPVWYTIYDHSILVGGFNPSEKYESLGMIIPNIWEKNVPNHQPVIQYHLHHLPIERLMEVTPLSSTSGKRASSW